METKNIPLKPQKGSGRPVTTENYSPTSEKAPEDSHIANNTETRLTKRTHQKKIETDSDSRTGKSQIQLLLNEDN